MGEYSRYPDCRSTERELDDGCCLGAQVLRAAKEREKGEREQGRQREFKLATASNEASYVSRSWA